MSPTFAPPWEIARARLAATVDFPTPPFPLTTAMMFFTPGKMALLSVRLLVVFEVKLTVTTASLSTSNFIALMHAFLIISFIGHAGVVNTTVKETLFPVMAISLTIFNVTRSLPRSGSCTFPSASSTFSSVIFKAYVKMYLLCKVNHCQGQIVLRNQQLVFIFGSMKKILLYTIIVFFLLPRAANAQFETSRDSVVQLYGVIMTADSLVGIPAVSVMVKGQNRGTITNNQGVFSIVVLKGDLVEFSHVTYKPKTITIPRNLEGNQYSVVQLMVIDTVYLPATIIRPRPTAQQFARDFVNTKVPDDNIEVARRNTDAAKRRVLLQPVPGDGG